MKYCLAEICTITKGITGITKAVPGKYPLVAMSEERKSHNEYQFDGNAVIVPLISSSGHGHASMKRVHYQEGKFAVGSILCAVIPNDEQFLLAKFLHIYLQAFKNDLLVPLMRGAANVSLPMSKLASVEIEVPSLERQLKIIELESNARKSIEKLALLFSSQEANTNNLREAIISEALQGKLVPQYPSEEPASELLNKIKAEKTKFIQENKIKREKPLLAIKKDEIPYKIPEYWVWCRLGDISFYSECGKSYKGDAVEASDGEFGVIKTSAVTSGTFIQEENKRLPNSLIPSSKILILVNDLLFCRASGSKSLAGKSCIVKNQPKAKLILSDKTIRYHLYQDISRDFINYFNSSFAARTYYYSLSTGKSTSMNNISRKQFDNLLIPLPPVIEQFRIVEKLEQLMTMCDDLEKSIQNSQTYTDQLLQVALKEALQEKGVVSEEYSI